MYINVSNTARRQVSEGYIIPFKKVLSCFYFQKQLLEDCQSLSCICCFHGLPSETVYYHNLPIAYKREMISLHLDKELESVTASLYSVCLCQQSYVRRQIVNVIILKNY